MSYPDRLEQILQRGTIRVGTSMDTPGFSMRAPDGALTGFDIDALQTLSATTDLRIDYVRMDFPTMLEELAADKFDIAMSGMGRTLHRATLATFSRPYLRNGRSVLVRAGDRARLNSLEAIDQLGTKVGHRMGAVNAEFARRAFQRATLMPFATNDEITACLRSGAVDAQVADTTVATYLARIDSAFALAEPGKLHEPVYVAILLNRGDQTLLNLINIWLDHIDQNGTLARLQEKWLGPDFL